MEDVSNKVLLTEETMNAWMDLAMKTASQLPSGTAIEDIPEEEIELLTDGRLRIHVTKPDGKVMAEMFIAADNWSWMQS